MAFLLKSDYAAQIRTDLLNTVVDSDVQILNDAELSAQAELESYLRGRYDVAKIFIDIQPWAEATQYDAGEVVSRAQPGGKEKIYTAKQATTGQEPGTTTGESVWVAKDPRHRLIITYMIDCTLYLIHSRQNPRGVPQLRQDRYDHVINWLNLCRAGKISPGLPFLADTKPDGSENTESIRIRTGSHPKLRNTY